MENLATLALFLFSQLWCNVQAIQILHDRAPFTLKVTNVPLPIYIYMGIILVYLVKKQVGAIVENALWIAQSLVYFPLTAAVIGATQIEKILSNVKITPELLKKDLALLSPLALVFISI